ncbi:hypothetical protein J3R83DRAFT_10982 [Lanmaoa asiatica]|nr:hypothetical protein J3R83DRAFT_10982 [Lanmaoa asiatica]
MDSDSTPLPTNPFSPSAFRAAYNQCLTLEAEASQVVHVEGYPPPMVCARLLGHLLRLAPAGHPQGQLQRDIALAMDHVALMQVATFYLNFFIRTFKRCSGPTPASSNHPSRPSFEDLRDYSLSLMEEGKLDHRTARTWAMRRDNNCCIVTGLVDYKQKQRRGQVIVQSAHIIPESTNTNIEEPGRKRSQSANMWSILSMFSRDNITDDLAGNRIHRLENIISMNSVSHQLFDELHLWLKPVEGALHTYRVCTSTDSLRYHTPLPVLPEYVTLSTTTELPLPNPEYLALHALCCEVAWMSGAAEYIMSIERRMDDTTVLANDGSTAELLITALSLIKAY